MRTKVYVAPWWDRGDYDRFRAMSQDDGLPRRYDQWAASALREIEEILRCGQAAQIVRFDPDRYMQWLADRGLSDSPPERERYAEWLAISPAGELPRRAEGSEGFPTMN